MARFAQILGVVLTMGGVALAVYGSPYYMLDWGGTFMVSGALVGCTGLILTMMGSLLRQVAGLRADLKAALVAGTPPPVVAGTASTHAPKLPAELTAAQRVPTQSATTPDPGATTALAAGVAGVAVGGGLAVAARDILSSVAPESEPQLATKPGEARPSLPDEPASRYAEGDAPSLPSSEAGTAPKPDPDEVASSALEADVTDHRSDLDANLSSLRAKLTDDLTTEEPLDGSLDAAVRFDAATDTLPEPANARNEPESVEASAPSRSEPAASQEGVIAAYTVGQTSFTMFADGRIRAEMPDSVKEFTSMEELKAFMAQRRLQG